MRRLCMKRSVSLALLGSTACARVQVLHLSQRPALQIHGRHWDEGTLFAVAYAYEQATMHRVPPPSFPECTGQKPFVPYSEVCPVAILCS